MSTEREGKSFHAWSEKLDFELSIRDGLRLSDQLIETLFGHCAVALLVEISAVRRTRRPSINADAVSHGRSRRGRAHHEMKIAGVKTICDRSVGFVQRGGASLHSPVAG